MRVVAESCTTNTILITPAIPRFALQLQRIRKMCSQPRGLHTGVLPGNHFSIIKPPDRNDLRYAAVKRLILGAVQSPDPPAPDPPPPAAINRPTGTSWLDPDAYFRRSERSMRYTHQWKLVGREAELDGLRQFMRGEHGRLGVLVGRGGLGKSKLLYAACQDVSAEGGVHIRFLDIHTPYDAHALADLPSGDLVVVIDDAHTQPYPLRAVINAVLEQNERAHVLLALRPYGESAVRDELIAARLAFDEAYAVRLDNLRDEDAQALAREALGEPHAHYASRLAGAGYDLPLVIVVGAALIKGGELDPNHLESNARLRAAVMDSYAAVVGADAAAQSVTRAEVLNAVAALQPVHAHDDVFMEALSGLAGQPFHLVQRELDELERMEVLLARGSSYRVVPDLLGDMLFARAACGSKGTSSTGYIDHVLSHAAGDALENLIVNAGRIDWQERSKRPSRLLNGLWAAVRQQFYESDAGARLATFQVFARVAYFQPAPCLELAQWAVEHPLAVQGQQAPGLAGAQSALTDAMCLVLRGVAAHREYFSLAVDLLWKLALEDTREPGQYPAHPLALLGGLARYTPTGPTWHQELMVDAVVRWVGQAGGGSRDPLEVLAPLLAAEGQEESFRPDAFVMSSFMIDPLYPPTAALRERVLNLVFERLRSPDPGTIAAALGMVGAALFGPIGRFGEVAPEVRALWEASHLDVLSRLRTLLEGVVFPAALYVSLRLKIQWLSEHGSAPIREACREIFAAIPTELCNDLARALHSGPIDPPVDIRVELDLEYRHRAQQDLFSAVGTRLRELEDAQAAEVIEHVINELHTLLGDEVGQARPFLFDAVKSRPALGSALLERVATSAESQLAGQCSIILLALVETVGDAAVGAANVLLATSHMRLAREVALVFGLQRGQRQSLLTGERELLRTLTAHEDAHVSQLAFGAIRSLAQTNPELAAELLVIVPPDDERFAWEEFAMFVGPRGTLPWRLIPEPLQEQVFRGLRQRDSLEGYALGELLIQLSHDEPRRVLDLLLDRAKALNNQTAAGGFSALRDSSTEMYRFRELPEFQDYLREVRDWFIGAPASGWRSVVGPQLFSAVAGSFDKRVLQVIEECFDAPTIAGMNAVALMLRNAPKNLLNNLEFVVAGLHAAQQASPECLSNVQGALHGMAFTGNRFGMSWTHTTETGEQRSAAAALADRCPPGSIEQQFYQSVLEAADRWNAYLSSNIGAPADGRDW
jgi:hypothetical protein